ncbi:MAG: thermonuclease family protein [Planctomycetes bacterium]|nr:thermonuclease family protein [Planctomycetota bacterium]
MAATALGLAAGSTVLNAAETQPVKVREITDGITLVVEASVGGVPVPISVRLDYVALTEKGAVDAEHPSPSAEFVKHWSPPASSVVLMDQTGGFRTDAFGKVLAVVCRDATEPSETGVPIQVRHCLQEDLIRAGWATYRTAEGEAPYPLHDMLMAAEKDAREAKTGAWAPPTTTEPAKSR